MEIYYTKDHEWVKVDGKKGTIGISSYAVEQLGDITFVELPEEEEDIDQSEEFCTIESVKTASDIYAPISGEIVEVNEELEDAPEMMNESPEEKAWIAKVEIKDKSELDSLMNESEYKKFLEELK